MASASEGSEMVRCNGAPPGPSTLGTAFLCLNSANINTVKPVVNPVTKGTCHSGCIKWVSVLSGLSEKTSQTHVLFI